MHWRRKWQPTPVFLPGESQGWGSPVGCHLWGRTELDTLKRLSSSSSRGSQVALVVKYPLANAGDVRDASSIPGSQRSPGGGQGNPLQYSCLENPVDRRAWRALVHRIAKSRTRLSDFACTHARDYLISYTGGFNMETTLLPALER